MRQLRQLSSTLLASASFLALTALCFDSCVYSQTRMSFVGCPSNGQTGPLEAPTNSGKLIFPVEADLAARLAYYKAENGPGVIGPRGWHCFGIYGSNGSSLFVSPEPLDSQAVFRGTWKGFTASAIQISISLGDTSGRFEVAKIIARVFPSRRRFVDQVIGEHIRSADDFATGPYPQDRLTYRDASLVEFETPAKSEGLGTQSRLLANDQPIRGVEMLVGRTPNLISLSLRLPAQFTRMESSIKRAVESDSLRVEK